MLHRILIAVFAACLLAPAADTPLNVAKLTQFIQSAQKQKMPDKEVAKFLKTCRMTERLDDNAIEELQSLGAGHETVQALKELGAKSASLPAALPVVPEAEPAPPPPPSSEEQGRILDEVRDYALNYTSNLPDFICTEYIVRSVAPSRGSAAAPQYRQVDTLTHHLTYFKQKEDYKLVMHNNEVVTGDKQKVGGSSSYGDFGSMMKLLFEPATQARFEWNGWGTVRGSLVYKFSYHVARDRSQYHITFGDKDPQDIITAYSGVAKIEKATRKVLEITMVAENIPPDFPVTAAGTTLDYEYTDISGHTFLLPSKALVLMTAEGEMSKNEKQFRGYGKYSADSSISFGDAPLPDEKPKDPVVKKKQ